MKRMTILAAAACIGLGSAATAAPILLTGIETDTVLTPAGLIGTGAPGEWTRFGASFDEMGITTNVSEVDAGAQALYVVTAWDAWGMGTDYIIPGGPINMSVDTGFSYRAKQTVPGENRVRIRIVETDGDVWVGTLRNLTTDYATYEEDLATSLTIDDPAGGGVLDLSQVARIGYVLLRNGQAANSVFFFDEIYYNVDLTPPPPPDPPDLPIVTSIEPPDSTTGGFPPDPVTAGDVGIWTRFGSAYNGIEIVNDSVVATDGDNYLQVFADFNPGAAQTRVGTRHVPYDSDWSAYDTINIDIKSTTVLAGTEATIAIFESNGNVWVSDPISVTADWATITIPFADFNEEGPSTGTFAANNVTIWGINYDNTVDTGQQAFQVDNVLLSNSSSISNWQLLD